MSEFARSTMTLFWGWLSPQMGLRASAMKPLSLVPFCVASLVVACSASRGGKQAEQEKTITSFERTADDCLADQDMDAADVDVSACPEIPSLPRPAMMGGVSVSLGAWEIGTTADGDTYKYGSLTDADADGGPRMLEFDGGSVAVNAENLQCWAKGYYRLRTILQNPPSEYVALRSAGFQVRFFQFQTDHRNGATGYRGISSYQNHLVKWVTVVSAAGECDQPTLSEFRAYASSELARRGLTGSADAGADADASTSAEAGAP